MTTPTEQAAKVAAIRAVLEQVAAFQVGDPQRFNQAVAAISYLDALAERATELEEIVRGGNCIRDESGQSPCERAEARANELERDLDEYRAANRYGIAGLMREKQAAEARAEQLERENERLRAATTLRGQYRDEWRERAERLETALREIQAACGYPVMVRQIARAALDGGTAT